MKVRIIGGGLAGCALAYQLKKQGAEPLIYESGPTLAGHASGNSVGLYNPRLSAFLDPQSLYFKSAFALALQTFPTLEDIDWNPCGALHLMTDEKKIKRFSQTVKHWGWGPELIRLVNAYDASEIAKTPLSHAALFLPQAGTVSPEKLCHAYTKNIEIYLNTPFTEDDFNKYDTDRIVICSGASAKNFRLTKDIPLTTIRGQITQIGETGLSQKLSCALCYGGYITPSVQEHHTLGATFQRWLDHTDILPQDDIDNLEKLRPVAPELYDSVSLRPIAAHRAGVRVSSPDHFPLVGRLQNTKHVFISTAHGSHGILSTLMAGQLLSDMILGTIPSLPETSCKALAPDRFMQDPPHI